MKATAWPAIPVFAAMLAAGTPPGPPGVSSRITFGVAAVLAAAMAPAALAHP